MIDLVTVDDAETQAMNYSIDTSHLLSVCRVDCDRRAACEFVMLQQLFGTSVQCQVCSACDPGQMTTHPDISAWWKVAPAPPVSPPEMPPSPSPPVSLHACLEAEATTAPTTRHACTSLRVDNFPDHSYTEVTSGATSDSDVGICVVVLVLQQFRFYLLDDHVVVCDDTATYTCYCVHRPPSSPPSEPPTPPTPMSPPFPGLPVGDCCSTIQVTTTGTVFGPYDGVYNKHPTKLLQGRPVYTRVSGVLLTDDTEDWIYFTRRDCLPASGSRTGPGTYGFTPTGLSLVVSAKTENLGVINSDSYGVLTFMHTVASLVTADPSIGSFASEEDLPTDFCSDPSLVDDFYLLNTALSHTVQIKEGGWSVTHFDATHLLDECPETLVCPEDAVASCQMFDHTDPDDPTVLVGWVPDSFGVSIACV